MSKKIIFTKKAKKQIEKLISKNNSNKFFRISVTGGGCSGFKYNFSFDNKNNKDDILFEKTIIDKNHIISPVDGKVVNIKEVFEKEYFKDKRIQLSIFMSPLNVHVTLSPFFTSNNPSIFI